MHTWLGAVHKYQYFHLQANVPGVRRGHERWGGQSQMVMTFGRKKRSSHILGYT